MRVNQAHKHQGEIFGVQKEAPWESINSVYHQYISFLVSHLRHYHMDGLGLVAGSLLAEPLSVAKAALFTPLGWKEPFNFYGLNPEKLKEKHLNQNPVFLIHGNYDNQRAWLGLAKKLQKEGIAGFTVNLPGGKLCKIDKELLEKRWQEIKDLYFSSGKKDVTIDIVGHSRGALLAVMMGMNQDGWHIEKDGTVVTDINLRRQRKHLGKIIQIGQYFSRNEFLERLASKINLKDNIFSITGSKDILAPQGSDALKRGHSFSYDTGHLGLLFSDEVERKIIDLLKS